jgi:hypothetical protein
MATKLTSKQQSHLAWLEALPPKLSRLDKAVELLASHQADEVTLRTTLRLLGELKSQGSTLGIPALAENFGYMETMLRRGGGHQMRVRGLRELLVGVKTNYQGVLKAASTPQVESEQDDDGPTTAP